MVILTRHIHFLLEMLAVKGINEALEGQDPQVTLRALQNPAAQLPQVMNNAGQLYHFEFRNIKAEKQVRIYRYNKNAYRPLIDRISVSRGIPPPPPGATTHAPAPPPVNRMRNRCKILPCPKLRSRAVIT